MAPALTSAAEFFESTLPVVLAARREWCLRMGGRIAFVLLDQPQSSWTVDLDRAEVVRGVEGEVSFRVDVKSDALLRMLDGTLDISLAMTAGTLKFTGDPSSLRKLASVMA